MKTNFDLQSVIDKSAFIVGGYSFTKLQDNVKVIGLLPPNHVLLMEQDTDILETNMDDIELAIVLGYWEKNKKYIGETSDAKVF